VNFDAAIRGRNFLVTGGTGSIGKALVAELASRGARRVVVLSRHASSEERADLPVELLDGDVTDETAVRSAVEGAEVVFHLAAEKDLDVCEAAPAAAVKTNVCGTIVILKAAQLSKHVDQVVVASTAQAVHATGVYGMSKALVERLARERPDGHVGSIAVRLAAIPGDGVARRWRRSIAERGEIEVTEPAMTRFVMTRVDAVSLLIRALAIREHGCVMAPAAKAYRLGDLADLFAGRYSARVRVLGVRRGESIHEHLVGADEAAYAERLETGDILITPGQRRQGISPLGSERATRLSGVELSTLFDLTEPVDA